MVKESSQVFDCPDILLLLLLLLQLYPLNNLFSRTTWVSQYQKGKTSLDLNEARDDILMLYKISHNGIKTIKTGTKPNKLSLTMCILIGGDG